jgi:serine/threonine protein kinase/predicted nucleic acid-binding protein
MIGQTISHYRIVEKLGEGGMGTVYIAEDTLLGRRVAIKTLNAGRTERGAHFRSRFLREARAVSGLSHPHIATIHDYGESADGQPYIVMELVKGETLGELMNNERLTIPRALEIIEQVAEALAEAHRHGIVHRDIKPTNVAIDHRGEVKVLDFGLAKQINPDALDVTDPERLTLLNAQTQEGIVIGTPMYLSPEQALGLEVDARSDLFSLGTLLYECIAGKPSFDGISRVEICTKVIRDDPPAPSQFNSDVNARLDSITLKALEKKPETRYQNAEEFIADLRGVRADSQAQRLDRAITRIISPAIGTRPTGTLATLSDIFKRPRLSVGYLSIGLILALAIGIAWWALTRTRAHQPTAEAQRLYNLAVDALREGAFFKSSKILQQAIQDDDNFALAHARLAEAWMELDFSDKAKDELIRASDLVPNKSVLPELDALRLQAITDTLKPDFAKAVEDYRSLASRVPEAERAFALVDLGRAYEKNEQLDQAIESYQDATKRNSHYAAAFLRLGVALRRSQRYADAETSFDRAHNLFDVSNEIEGIAEVLYQRGILFSQQSKLPEARTQLQQALQRSVALENKDQHIKVLQQLSNTYIVAGDAAKAHEYSQQAMELAQASGMENLTTAGLIEIGNAYLAKTNYPEAERNFNEALRLAQLYKGRYNEARALLSLASLRKQQENPDAARDLAQRALLFFEAGRYGKQTSIAYAILGHAYDELGDYESAQRAFEHQLQLAQQVGDQRSAALAHEGLGIVFLHTERLADALIHFDEDYRIANLLTAKLIAGYAADYRGTVFWQLGNYDQARPALAEALTIAAPPGSDPYKELLADVTVSEAALALSAGKLAEAAIKAQKALDLSGSEFKSISVRANCTLSLARARLGQGAAARKSGEAALTEARSMSDPRPLSEALLASAEAALVAGDSQSALTNAIEAQKRFAAAKQHESEWRAWLIQARATQKAGDKTRAIQLASQAAGVLANLEQEWGSDNYRSYLTRADVQECRSQLAAFHSR